jgi:HAD superfamily hydrolase (TIGR01509 family)
MDKTKLVIFDCDGVLVDSEQLTNKVFAQMVRSMGGELTDKDAHKLFIGGTLDSAKVKIEALLNQKMGDDFADLFRAEQHRVFKKELKCIPGIHEALEGFPWQKCIASNGPMIKMDQTLEITDLQKFFDKVYSAYDVQKWKPEPGLFLHAASEFSVLPKGCVVVEDSGTGVRAARAANMALIIFNCPSESAQSDKEISIQHMSELRPAVAKLLAQ